VDIPFASLRSPGPILLLACVAVSVLAGCKSTASQSPKAEQQPTVVAQSSAPPASVPNVPLASPPAAAQPTPRSSDEGQLINPSAMQALDRMGAYLRTLNAFEIQAFTTTDEVVDSGLKIQLDGTVRMQVKRPDRLRMLISSDRKQRELYFDGKNFTLVAPRVKYYAVTPAPPTLAALFDTLESYDIEMPLGDLFLWGSDRSSKDDVRLAMPMGPAMIDGSATDHYLIGQDDVSWQVWIQKGDKPLPRKLVITTLSEPQQPQFTVLIRWNTAPRLDDKSFTYAPGKDAVRIPLRPPQASR
jgi:hypothetical protein